MKVVTFIAQSVPDAVAQIRGQLGTDAVVLNVRQLPADGLSRLWKRPRIEVLACKPDPAPLAEPTAVTELREELEAIKQHLPRPSRPGPERAAAASRIDHTVVDQVRTSWRVFDVLLESGLLPVHAQRIVDELRSQHGDEPPVSLAAEMALARGVLGSLWRPAPVINDSGAPHVFVGPPGVGKTTVLCKWLAQTVLMEARPAQVWRLDGNAANMAESLSVHGEILGIPVERTWAGPEGVARFSRAFIDFPGTDWRDAGAVRELRERLRPFGACHVHLVLNAAYETPVLMTQVRAFTDTNPISIILTHLDEESRWGKVWNLVLGTNLPVRFLGAGQNVPGVFWAASAEKILSRQFPL